MIKKIIVYILLGSVSIYAKQLKIDSSHTSVGFKITHLVISTVSGTFSKFDGAAEFNKKAARLGKINLKINSSSISTNEPDRDKHLKGGDFFNVKKYPVITFTSNGGAVKKGQYINLPGKISIRDITKNINLKVKYNGSVKDPWDNIHHSFTAEGEISRKDFGLNWNKSLDQGGVMIGEKVKLLIEAQILE